MASNTKKVTLDVAVKTQEQQIDALESKINKMRQQKIQLKLDADTAALNKVTDDLAKAEAKVNQMNSNKLFFATETDAVQKLQQAESEVNRLKQQQINLQVQVESYKLDDLQSKKDAIEADEINVQLNNQSAMQGLEQIADGFSRIKSAASQVGQQFGDLLASAGKQETNFKFLENAVGNAETARQKMSEINDIVAKLPGDDTALQGLLSSAVAKDSSLTADNLRSMANSATDYFSAMSYYGKSATEAQQDMTNYLLAGNTAELERSPILQGHIDKLKEATTVQERSKALAEALNAEHWGGMGAMDTYNNKLETFNGMIERGRCTLGGMFQKAAKGGMDFLLKLDESTNGIVGMTIAAAGFASPITDALMGLGQIATGINAIKETKIAEWAGNAKNAIGGIGERIRGLDVTSKFNTLKNSLIRITSSAKTTAISLGTTLWNGLKTAAGAAKTLASDLLTAGKNALISGANALKAGAMWAIEAGKKAISTAATKAAALAQGLLNAVMAMNPIMLVVIAITALIAVLGYLYFTNEDVRNAINGLGQSLLGLGGTIYGYLVGAFEYLQGAWQNTVDWFSNGAQIISDTVTGAFNWIGESVTGTLEYLNETWTATVDWLVSGGQWISDSLTGAFTWLNDVWNTVVNAFMTYAPLVAQILFVMATGGVGAIILLIANFMGMPNQVGAALQNVINRVVGFVSNLVSNFTTGASNSVNNFINKIKEMPARFKAELDKMIQDAIDFAKRLPEIIASAAGSMVLNWGVKSGEHSPGFMYDAFKGELDAMTHLADNTVIDMGSTAENMVKSWGSPELEYQINQLMDKNSQDTKNDNNSLIELLRIIIDILRNMPKPEGGSFTFNHYGDTDSEERMQRILEEVRRDFYWNNEKAGRNVEERYGV